MEVLMKRIPLFLLVCAAFSGAACERHSASSLPAHGGGHADAHEAGAPHAAPAESGKEHAKAAPEQAKPVQEQAKPAEASGGKFFEPQPK